MKIPTPTPAVLNHVFLLERRLKPRFLSFGYAVNYVLGSLRHDPAALTTEEVDKRLKERGVATARRIQQLAMRGEFTLARSPRGL